jgi:DNA-binding response OmpR family regulator
MAAGKILVVDDERKIVNLVRAYLERDGYEVVAAYDGKAAVAVCRREAPDLVVLDIMLPELDGWEVCRQIRRFSSVPIIMLTARDEDADKLVGLELGADDYVTKPFSPRVLVARVKAVLRRARDVPSESRMIRSGELVIDEERFLATCHGQPLSLTPTEFRVLAALASERGRVLSRAQLLDMALGESFDGYDRTVDAHIKNLRRKLAAAGGDSDCRIVTVHGVGYRL